MDLILGTQVSKLDCLAEKVYGLSGLQLMENAGAMGANYCKKLMQKNNLDKNLPIAIFAGKGNNGGDGFVVARHLANCGYKVRLFIFGAINEFKGAAKANLAIALKLNLPYLLIDSVDGAQTVDNFLAGCGLIVDGIFGTGFKGEVGQPIATYIDLINKSKKPVIALDVPSGVDATTGQVGSRAVQADLTVTFGWAKLGTRILPGKTYVGELVVADISLPKELLSKVEPVLTETDSSYVGSCLPKRAENGHKGSFGHCLVVGGSKNMYGAPILATGAALRVGAGLVTLGSVEGVSLGLTANFLEAMSLNLPSENKKGQEIALENLDFLQQFAKDKVLILGMGLGRLPQTQSLALALIQCDSKGLVVDADGLFALGANPIRFKPQGQVVLTPHPKEMGLLLNQTTAEVESNRLEAVQACAAKYGATVVLKGAGSLICTTQGKVFLNPTGNPGMATGGSGDVLAGIIGGLMAQGLSADSAAVVGVYLHGLAGDLGKKDLSEMGLVAGDLIRFLPKAVAATLA